MPDLSKYILSKSSERVTGWTFHFFGGDTDWGATLFCLALWCSEKELDPGRAYIWLKAELGHDNIIQLD